MALALRTPVIQVTPLPSQEKVTAVAPVEADAVAPPTTSETPAPDSDEDLVPSLPKKGPGARPAAAKRPPAKKAAEATPETPPPPKPEDFNFLQPEPEKPASELKRPSF